MVIDTLEILIEADSTGLTTKFNQAYDTITGFVSKMNDQEVDWTSILSKSISPAIITGIASLFAAAITSTLQFNQAIAQQGEAVGLTTGQMQQFGTQSQTIAAQTGQSATDINQAMTALYPVFGQNASAAAATASQIAELSASGFGSIADITQAAIPIMEAWGVTTSDQASTVLTAMLTASQTSGQSFEAIGSSIQQFQTGFIKAGATVAQFSNIVNTFGASVVSSGGITQATQMFQSLGSAVGQLDQGGIALASISGGVGTLKSLIADGKTQNAMLDIANAVKNMAPYVATAFDVPPTALNGMNEYVKNFSTVQSDLQAITAAGETIQSAFNNSDTALRHLMEDWQAFLAMITNPSLAKVLDALGGSLSYITTPAVAAGVQTYPGFNASGPQFQPSIGSGLSNPFGSGSGNSNTFNNTFNISSPAGSATVTASAIAKQLYDTFQGTTK